MYLLQTLGKVALHADPEASPGNDPLLRSSKTLVLVAYLADRPDRTATREHLAELFWPGVPSSSARRSLRQALYFLARSGGEGILESDGDRIRVRADACVIDSERFEQALTEAKFEDAADLYTGPFLQGFAPGRSQELRHWIESVRERLAVGHRQALRECARTALVQGRPEVAVECARRAAAAYPIDDSICALLLESLVAAGRPDEAVREYEAYRVLLREELEDLPSDEITGIGERARQLVLEQNSESEPIRGPAEPEPEPDSPPSPSPLPDRRRTPASPTKTGPGLLIRSILFVTVTAAIFLVVLRGSDWLFGGGRSLDSESGRAGAETSHDRWNLLRVIERTTDGARPVTLRFIGEAPDRATLVPGSEGEVGSLTFRSPDGRLISRRVQTPNGPDLEIIDAVTGSLIAAIPNRDGGTPDDHAHDWSPDSRILLMSSGMFADDGSYDHRHFLFDVETGEMRSLADRRIAPSRSAGWSPRGDRIAFEGFRDGAGIADIRTDLFLASVDGRDVRALTDDDLREQDITWSPDGTRLAYVKGDLDRGDIHVLDPSTGEERPIAASVWPETSPEWISDHEVAYLEMHEEGSRLMVASVEDGTPARRIPVDGDVGDLLQRLGGGGEPAAWIESVTASVQAPGGILSPGGHAVLDVTIRDSRGAIVHPDECEFAWRVLDPDRAEIVEDHLLAALDTGTIRVVADVAGWRADTLTLVSAPLKTSDTELLFEESWQSGIRPDIWQVFGEPAPAARPDGGPEGGGRFRNQGDRNHTSGAVTLTRFPVENGITVESWARVPTTDEHFQTWLLDVAGDPMLEPGSGERPGLTQPGRLMLVSSVSKGGPTAFIGARDTEIPVPEPARIAAWRRHTLQLHPDGMVEWIVDGRRHASASSGTPAPDSVHVTISGHSQGTEIEHGTVRVWRGLRYVPE